jgi:hypothetical protein
MATDGTQTHDRSTQDGMSETDATNTTKRETTSEINRRQKAIDPLEDQKGEVTNETDMRLPGSNERRRHDNGRSNERDNERNNQHEITRDDKTAMEASIRGFEKKCSNIIELTDTPTKLSIETMCCHLAHQANNSSIPMRSLQEVERGHPIHPDSATNDLHPQVLERCSATLFHKLETLIPETAPTYHDTVAQNTSGENGCATLCQILRTVLPKLQDFRPKWGPFLDKNQDMFRFVRVIQEHATSEAEFNRPCKELETITNVIQHALDNNRCKMTARTAKATIQSAPAQGTRVTLTMQNIA